MGGRCAGAFVIVFIACCTLYSCAKDKALPPVVVPPTCDSLNPSYTTCIQPIFKDWCYACHSDSASVNGTIAFDMENFNSLKTYLNYYYRGDSIYGSKFMAIISHKLGVIPMPPSGNVPQSNIDLIQAWVNKGALSN